MEIGYLKYNRDNLKTLMNTEGKRASKQTKPNQNKQTQNKLNKNTISST